MVEFQNDLMMGVIVASAAFMGLTMVHMSQVAHLILARIDAPGMKQEALKTIKEHRLPIVASFICGTIALLLAIIWFFCSHIVIATLSTLALIFQVSWFWPLVIRWYLT